MIPVTVENFQTNGEDLYNTSLTYQIKAADDRIKAYIDGIDAVRQAIYKILMTEKGKFQIYDENFGIQLSDLFGENIYYVESEIAVRIKNALLYDDRILRVFDFSFSYPKEKGVLSVRFFVSTVFGETDFDLEVTV